MRLIQIYDHASHYRSAIYQKIDKEFGADIVVGDERGDIMPMDYGLLTNQVTIIHNYYFKYGYYQKGVFKFLFKNYDTYLITGEFRCISTWILMIGMKFFPQKKLYIWTHGWLGKENGVKRIIHKAFFRLSDGIFVYNNRSKDLMIKGGVSPDKITTIYNSLDYELQIVIRNKLHPSGIYQNHFGNDRHVIIFLGRLTKVKRLDWLIAALHILHHRGEYYNLVIVGDGENRGFLEKKAEEEGVSKSVWFCGACYDEGKNAEYFYNADLCVSPGNVGLTAIHAMTYGCPVITNDDFNHQMPEFEAIEKGKTGDFFQNGNVESLANTIMNWFLSSSYDRELLRKDCYAEIDTKWNTANQIRIFKSVFKSRL